MKKSVTFFATVLCFIVTSCMHNKGHVSISYSDNEDAFSMNAYFDKSRTRSAEYYMNRKIGDKNNFSFINTQTDATLTLNDGTKFYMMKSPGHIKIRVAKDENTQHDFYAVKAMCEGMKDLLIK